MSIQSDGAAADGPAGCAWITGASSGLGRALALSLARAGWSVVASARRGELLDELAREADGLPGRIAALPVDVTDAAAVSRAVAHIEVTIAPIALAVLNAGSHRVVDPARLAVEDFRSLVELNLMGTVNCLAAALPGMQRRGSGRIAIVASLAGYVGLPTAAAYGMTKAGLINMAESLRPELATQGITLQLANPGFVDTPLAARNRFAMPFLMSTPAAVAALQRGLASDRFEIVFPWRFAMLMKLLRLLPYPLLFRVTRRLAPRYPPVEGDETRS